MQKQERFQGTALFSDLQIGQVVLNQETKQEDHIVNLTENTIEVFINADRSSIDLQAKLKGISYTNWFTLDGFNRKFKLV